MIGHEELLKRLLPVAYDINGPLLLAELFADGNALDAAQQSVTDLMREIDPRTTVVLLTDWERVAGLPDDCTGEATLSIDQRRIELVAKMAMRGGQSRAWFIDLAAKLGFGSGSVTGYLAATCVGRCSDALMVATVNNQDVTIDEFRPMTCSDTCNDALFGETDRFAWRINLPSTGGVLIATCNSDCNSPLQAWGNAMIECAINKFKPAHTTAIFAYF